MDNIGIVKRNIVKRDGAQFSVLVYTNDDEGAPTRLRFPTREAAELYVASLPESTR